jgi:pimeloyl-ACP methyl ester carboxylesterase
VAGAGPKTMTTSNDWPGWTEMTAVFVHGALETDQLWERVLPLVDEDSIALRLPGHGCPRPEGFSATKDAYAMWLAAALGQVADPADLVGHGWGGLLVLRLVTALDVPVRSWVVDGAGAFHPDFVVSDTERIWQTPDEGERWMSTVRSAPPASPGGAAGRLALLGVPRAQAAAIGAAFDEVMSGCVLELARSAIPNAGSGWPARTGASGAGLVILPGADQFDRDDLAQEVAHDLGAQLRRLNGLGHCWMAEAPELAANVLIQFWSSLED